MERNKSLDSAKFILIFFVVLAHTCEYDLFTSKIKLLIYIFSSTFTIPLFIIISGYFSKNLTWDKFKKFFLGFVLVYYLFQLFYSIPSMAAGHFNIVRYILLPIGPLWYLAGLILWRYIIILIKKFNIPAWASLLISTAISLSVGFIKIDPILHPDYVSALRILVFIPHFFVGYYAPQDIWSRIKNIKKIYSILFFTIFGIWVCLYGTSYHAFTTFGGYSYSVFPTITDGLIQRLIFLVFAIFSSAVFFNIIPDTFYKFGSASLGILLLHIMIVYPIYWGIVTKHFSHIPLVVDILAAITITLVCLFLTKLKIIQLIMNPLKLIEMIFSKNKKIINK